MADLFEIVGRLSLDGVDRANSELLSVTGTAESTTGRFTSAFKKIGTAIATAFAVDKIKDFGTTLVQTSADIQAENAQFEASFGDLTGSATEMFNRVGEATGVFATRLRVTGTKAYSQLKGSGMDANEALAQTETFLNLASDAAAYYDISLEDAEQRIRSFMRGNVEAGDAIGLFTSESQRNTYALEMYGQKWLDLTEAQKQNLMLNVASDIYTQSGAIGQAGRESDGLANVTGNLKEVWRQFLGVIGSPVLEAVTPILQGLTEKVQNLKSWVEQNEDSLNKVGTAISTVVDFTKQLCGEIVNVIGWFIEHDRVTKTIITTMGILTASFVAFKAGAMIQSVVQGFQSANLALSLFKMTTDGMTISQGISNGVFSAGEIIVGLLTGKITLAELATGAWSKAQAVLNGILSANPIALVVTAVGALIAIFVTAYRNSETFRNAVNNLWNNIKQFGASATQIAIKFKNDVLNALKELPSRVINIGTELVKGLWTGISNAGSWLKNKVSTFCKNIVNSFKSAFSINSPSRVMRDSVGVFLAQGIGDGIEADDSAEKSIQNKVRSVIGIANGGLSDIRVGANVNAVVGENPMQKYQLDLNAQIGTLNDGFDRTIALIGEYLPDIAKNIAEGKVIDANSLAIGMSKKMDTQFGRMAIAKGRGNV